MESLSFTRAANLLAFLFLIAAFLYVVRAGVAAQLRLFTAQSAVLSILAAVVAVFGGSVELVGVALVFAIIRVVVIPMALRRLLPPLDLQPELAVRTGRTASIVAAAVLVFLGFYIATPLASSAPLPTSDGIAPSFASVLLALFLLLSRRGAAGQIFGFLALENAVFMVALLAAYRVPLIVEMGVFLDLLAAALILAMTLYRIQDGGEHGTPAGGPENTAGRLDAAKS